MDRHVVHARAGRRGAAELVALGPLRRGAHLHRRAAGVRGRLCALRGRVEPRKHGHLPDHPGDSRRHPAGGRLGDGLPDRAAGEDRRGHGHVRPRHHRRARDRPHAGRLPGRVRGLAAHLLHQRAGRHPRRHRRRDGVAQRSPAVKSQRFDVLGFLTIAGGLFALLLALSEGQSWGWSSYRIIILLSAAPILLGPLRDHRARGRIPAARRAGLQVLAVHELAVVDLRADGRPVRDAVLRAALPPAGPGPRSVRRGFAALAAGVGHGGADADRGTALRQDRSTLACGDRADDRRHRHVLAAQHVASTSAAGRSRRCSRYAQAGWAWR